MPNLDAKIGDAEFCYHIMNVTPSKGDAGTFPEHRDYPEDDESSMPPLLVGKVRRIQVK